MSVIEFIGFIVSMAAMGFLFLKRLKESRYRQEHPEEFDEESHAEVEELRRFLASTRMREEGRSAALAPRPAKPPEMPKPPQPRKSVAKQSLSPKPVFQSSMEGYRQAAEMERLSPSAYDAKRATMAADPYADRSAGSSEAIYAVDDRRRDSRGGALIRQQRALQDMFILKAILEPPKAMQPAWTDSLVVYDEHP